MRLALSLVLAVLLSSPESARSEPLERYALDGVSRVLAPGSALPCERGDVALETYRGTHLRYASPLRVHPAFVARLAAFEEVVRALAVEVYGRAPRRIAHLGSFNCRTMRRYPDWVSEHALGNALDLAGFDFARAAPDDVLPEALPRALRAGFRVRMDVHWSARHGAGAVHASFLRALARRLIARDDIFSVVLGPAWPGHHNHLHLDRAPYRVVEVFGRDDAS